MTAYTFSKLPTANFNTTPPSIARSATGSVYDIADTGFLTPLNMTLVVGGAVVTTISSDALGILPDFTLLDRVNCVWKQTGTSFATVLTTSDPIPGPPGPNTVPTATAIASEISTPGTPAQVALTATYAGAFPAAQTIAYNTDGSVQSVTESGITTTYTYNTDGTVATDSRTVNGVTTVRNYGYTNGNLTSITKAA